MGEAEIHLLEGLQDASRAFCPRTSRSRRSSEDSKYLYAPWCARWFISSFPEKRRQRSLGPRSRTLSRKGLSRPGGFARHGGRDSARSWPLAPENGRAQGRRPKAHRRNDPAGSRALASSPDDEIIERLTAARGVGRWTVEMYLIFTLGRQDILPIDDLGVRKGAEKLYRREFTPKALGEYGKRWAPWRSAAAWHLWRVMDTQTPEQSKNLAVTGSKSLRPAARTPPADRS